MTRSTRFYALMLVAAAFVLTLGSTSFAQAAIPTDAASPYLKSQATIGYALPQVSYFLGLGLVGLGAAFGLSKAVSTALESIARQPEAAGDIRGAMILGCALIEALAIYVLISPFLAGGLRV